MVLQRNLQLRSLVELLSQVKIQQAISGADDLRDSRLDSFVGVFLDLFQIIILGELLDILGNQRGSNGVGLEIDLHQENGEVVQLLRVVEFQSFEVRGVFEYRLDLRRSRVPEKALNLMVLEKSLGNRGTKQRLEDDQK